MSVYIDLTEFLKNPVLSGIQRVTAQICRHFPGELLPVKFLPSYGLARVNPSLIHAVASHFEENQADLIQQIDQGSSLDPVPLVLTSSDRLLVPELFYDPLRVLFYSDFEIGRPSQLRFIVYDLIPLEFPEFFPGLQFDFIAPYFQLIRRIPHCAFISESTQRAYCRRLLRRDQVSGDVIRLGSDGFGPKPLRSVGPRGAEFCVVGRIEPSKNARLLVRVIEPMLRAHPSLRVTFLGKVGHIDQETAELFFRMANDSSGLEHVSDPNDELIRQAIDRSRALICLSAAEGFGLPPVESLWRGTPVIASPAIPSLEKIGSIGVHRVDPLNPSGVDSAIGAFLDDGYFARKRQEAASLELPTWSTYATELAAWCGC